MQNNKTKKELKYEKNVRKGPGILTGKEIDKLFSQPDMTCFKGLRDKAMLELVYATGIKATQLINLKVQDVDTKAEIITCITENERRTVPYGSFCAESINRYLEVSKEKERNEYLNKLDAVITKFMKEDE